MAQLGRSVKQSVLWTVCSESPRGYAESGSALGATCYRNVRVFQLNSEQFKCIRGMAQLVARLSGGQEAVSSSLATPTTSKTTNIA